MRDYWEIFIYAPIFEGRDFARMLLLTLKLMRKKENTNAKCQKYTNYKLN